MDGHVLFFVELGYLVTFTSQMILLNIKKSTYSFNVNNAMSSFITNQLLLGQNVKRAVAMLLYFFTVWIHIFIFL